MDLKFSKRYLPGKKHLTHPYILWCVVLPLLSIAVFIVPVTARISRWRRAPRVNISTDDIMTIGQLHYNITVLAVISEFKRIAE
jgi:hypothetical protein